MKISASPSLSFSDILRIWRGKSSPVSAVPGLAWVADGRTALEAALRLLGRPGPWLIPAYCCPALTQTFAAAGVQVEYYPVDESLNPCWDDLRARIEKNGIGGLLFVHYFGFRIDWTPIKALIAAKSISVIEDCAHLPMPDVLAADPLGSDARIYSPRKWLPIPHGGALILKDASRSAQSLFKPETPDLLSQLLRGGVLALERGASLGLRGWLLSLPAFERRLERNDALGHVYGLSMDPRVAAFIKNGGPASAEIQRKQRANYETLAASFAGLSAVTPWRRDLADGDCPFTFPLLVDPGRRDHVLRRCLRRGILARAYWKTLPPLVVTQERYAVSRRLSERIVCLPIHYGLTPGDLREIRDVVASALDRS